MEKHLRKRCQLLLPALLSTVSTKEVLEWICEQDEKKNAAKGSQGKGQRQEKKGSSSKILKMRTCNG